MSRIWIELTCQFKRLAPLLVVAYLPVILGLAVLAIIGAVTGIAPSRFLRDPVEVAKAPPYTGCVSQFGCMLWAAGASISLFTAMISGGRKFSAPLRFFGLLTLVLLMDDLFMLHERWFPKYLGIREPFVFGSYLVTVIVGVTLFRREILRTDYLLLLLAAAFFAGALFVDQLPERYLSKYHHLLEDGHKLGGIVAWLLYLVRTSGLCLRSAG